MQEEAKSRFTNHGVFTDESIRDFIAEAEEQLSGIEQEMLALEEERSSRSRVEEIFRHLHGLKGNTGLVLSESEKPLPRIHPLNYLQTGIHAIESAFDHLRQPAAPRVTDEEMAFLFEALDFLKEQVNAFREGALVPVRNELFLARLGLCIADFEGAATAAPDVATDVFRDAARQSIGAARAFLKEVHVGNLNGLKNLHRCVGTLVKAARYAGEALILDPAERQFAVVEEALRAGAGVEQVELLLALQKEIESIFDSSDRPEASPQEPSGSQPAADTAKGMIRVDQHKIDELLRMVGQLLVLKNGVADLAARLDGTHLEEGLRAELRGVSESLSRASDELREAVVTLRLFPMRNLFKRFQRLIRDLSISLGKEIRLTTQGESIELDKTLLDQISEPMVHLLRNAADHGIETAEVRKALGKPPHGTISIQAFRESSTIVIEVSDDGTGLDMEAVTARAFSLGLIDDASTLGEAAVRELIFHPGFSTAASVTSVSGRGVGMDAVRNAIRSLRGTVSVRTLAGHGTTFQIRLPASLLLTKGILVESGAEEYIIPIESIRDLVRIDARELRDYRGMQLAQIGERTLPVVSLRSLLGIETAGKSTRAVDELLSVAVINHAAFPFGLSVDRFQGEMEAVVRPLETQFCGFEICLGAAILGNGRVVLVLNAEEVSRRVFGRSETQGLLEN